MKAKYKNTGEIVDVEPAGTLNCTVAVYEEKDGRKFPMYALEFEKDINWEQRRYEIAKDVMQGILSNASIEITLNDESSEYHSMPKVIAKEAITFADALIAELKKGGTK